MKSEERLERERIYARKYHQNHKDDKDFKQKALDRSRKHYEENRSKKLAYAKSYREANKEKVAIVKKRWVGENKEHVLNFSRKYREDNRDSHRASRAKRRAAKLNASFFPNTNSEHNVNQIYKLCDIFNNHSKIEWQVDHDVPLVHSKVCGLHSVSNLNILTKYENLSKNNSFN